MKIPEQKSSRQDKKEFTVSSGLAHLYGLFFLIPIILLLAVPFYYLWPEQFTSERLRYYLELRDSWNSIQIGFGVVVVILGIVGHELLHGIGWSVFTKNGWKSIRFGIKWEFLTPYCHCSEPLLINLYRFGSILPAIVLGFLPSAIALISGNLGLMIFGFFFTFSASGDFLILWLIRNEKSSSLVQDHPDKIGCIILQNPGA